jgi:hypothetical protein
MSTARDELAALLFTTDNCKAVSPWSEWEHSKQEPRLVEYVYAMADALIAAGYVKADHTEYAADHRFSDIEFTDEDGELWTDREDFEEYFKEYGGCKLVQRHVTPWEPVKS